jgi:hypothetical protein
MKYKNKNAQNAFLEGRFELCIALNVKTDF